MKKKNKMSEQQPEQRITFPCHFCGFHYNTPQELVNHWLEFRDFQETGLKQLLQMFVKFVYASVKLGYYQDIQLATNLFSYESLEYFTRNPESQNSCHIFKGDEMKKRIKRIREQEPEILL